MGLLVYGNQITRREELRRGPSQDHVRFERFSPPDGGFSIVMPSQPKKQAVSTEPVAGVSVTRSMFTAFGHDAAYVVGFCDFPPEIAAKFSESELLDLGSRHLGGLPLTEGAKRTPVSLGTHPGMELRFIDGQDHWTVRRFMVGRRLIVIEAITPRPSALQKEMDGFFGSLRVESAKKTKD